MFLIIYLYIHIVSSNKDYKKQEKIWEIVASKIRVIVATSDIKKLIMVSIKYMNNDPNLHFFRSTYSVSTGQA